RRGQGAPRHGIRRSARPRAALPQPLPVPGAARDREHGLVAELALGAEELARREGQRLGAERLLDAQALVPFRHALRAREAAHLELADDLHPLAQLPRESLHCRRIVLGERVLDRDDRVAGEPPGEERMQLARGKAAVLEPEVVAAAAMELRRGDIQSDADVDTRLEACIGNGADELDERFLVAFERRPVAALVGYSGEEAAL